MATSFDRIQYIPSVVHCYYELLSASANHLQLYIQKLRYELFKLTNMSYEKGKKNILLFGNILYNYKSLYMSHFYNVISQW